MNRLDAKDPSVPRRRAIKAAGVISLCALALACLLPSAAFAQFPDPDPDPDPDPGPFCLSRQSTGLPLSQIFAAQAAGTCANWSYSAASMTFAIAVKLRPEHRYASNAESCVYDDGLWTSYGRSINVSESTPQLFLRTSPTTTQANVSIIDTTIGVRYSFNARYQENVGAFSSDFNPMRRKKLCVYLPAPSTGLTMGCAPIVACP